MFVPLWLLLLLCAFAVWPVSKAVANEPGAGSRSYFSLIDGSSFDSSGYLRITLTDQGHATVAVKLGSEPTCVVFMDVDLDSGALRVVRGGDPDMQVELHLARAADGSLEILGSVSDDGITVPVHAFSLADIPALVAGTYTFVLGESGVSDAGCGSLRVSGNGNVRAIISLPDGRTVSAGGRIGADGKWRFFTGRRLLGALSGELAFGHSGNTDSRGIAHRRLPARAGREESSAPLAVAGSLYFKDRAPVLLVPAAALNTSIGLAPAGAAAIAVDARLSERNVFTIPTAGDRNALLVHKATGLVSGKLTAPDGRRRTLRGAVLQSRNEIAGFIKGDHAGTFAVAAKAASLDKPSGSSFASNAAMSWAYDDPGAEVAWAMSLPTLIPPIPVSGGTLIFNPGTSGSANASIQSSLGAVVTAGGSLTVRTNHDVFVSNGLLSLGGVEGATGARLSFTGATLAGSGSITRPVTLTNGGTLSPGSSPGQINSGTLELGLGVDVTGASLQKTGVGTLVLNGNNTYAGTTTVNTGATFQIATPVGNMGGLTGGFYPSSTIPSGEFTGVFLYPMTVTKFGTPFVIYSMVDLTTLPVSELGFENALSMARSARLAPLVDRLSLAPVRPTEDPTSTGLLVKPVSDDVPFALSLTPTSSQ